MAKRVIMKPKKMKKVKSNSNTDTNIEKKPYSEEERLEKLREDRIKIAKRYEEMRLYDEAINYYKKLGMNNDVDRVTDIKKEIYFKKAKDFERNGKFEDALRLYENLKLLEDASRLKKIMGDDDFSSEPEQSSSQCVENKASDKKQQIESQKELTDPKKYNSNIDERADQSKENFKKSPQTAETSVKIEKRIFKICPYCGEEFNLPKNPNFCPFCKEPFV